MRIRSSDAVAHFGVKPGPDMPGWQSGPETLFQLAQDESGQEPMELSTPTMAPPSVKASGIMVPASRVRIAPAAK